MKNKIFYFLILSLITLNIKAHDPHIQDSRWNGDPYVIGSLFILTLGFLIGNCGKKKQIGKLITFFTSIFFLVIALLSPLDLWSDQLQAWHMIQHMLIMMIAAPFFVLSSPLDIFLHALPTTLKKKAVPILKWLYGHKSGWYFFWQPLLLWSTFALTLWIWHLPRFYEAALRTKWVHDFQHISFFIVSCLFWRILLDPLHRFKFKRTLGILYLFATTLHATLLGVFMTLSPKVWYPFYIGKTRGWDLSPMEDQQLAGLIMWMPACMVYVFVTAYIFRLWINESNTQASP